MIYDSQRRTRASFGFRHIIYKLCALSILLVSLSGCDFVSSSTRLFEPSSSNEKTAKTSVSLADARNLATPASESGMSVDPVTGLKNNDMAGPKGLNTSQLFVKPVQNDDERLGRLERAVQAIYDELADIKPPVRRLIAIEKDIQDLIAQLETLLTHESVTAPTISNPQAVDYTAQIAQKGGSNSAPSTAPPQNLVGSDNQGSAQNAQAPPAPKEQTPPAAKPPDQGKVKTTGEFVIRDVRMGDHAGKTRLVIETDRKMSYSADIDNAENLLTVIFDKGQMGITPSSIKMESKLIKAASSSAQSDGSLVMVFNLARDSALIDQGQIGPNKDNPNHRLYLDLKR